jgi:hypothetical protein
LEDQPFGEDVELFPRDSFDRFLKVKETFAGVAEPLAGLEIGL